MAAQIWLREFEKFGLQENYSAASWTLKNLTDRSSCKGVICVILPSNLACCVFKTPTGLDSKPTPPIFSPGYRPEAPGKGGTLMFNSSIQIIHSSLCRHVGLCSLSQKIPTELFFRVSSWDSLHRATCLHSPMRYQTFMTHCLSP